MNKTWCRALLIAGILLTSMPAQPQATTPPANYPAKSVRVLVGWAPGGGLDFVARLFSQRLSESLGHQFLVENRPGASGNIATNQIAKGVPDGYTLLVTSVVHSINASLFTDLPFDPVKDFSPIGTLASSPNCIAVNPTFPVNSLSELIALAKSKPDAISYASGGNGTLQHIGMELFASLAGIKFTHVPYNGAGPSIIAVVGGHMPVLSTSLGVALQQVRAGKLRMLAVTSAERTPLAPEFPTVAESAKLAGFETLNWVGLMAPGGTPPAIISKLNAEIARLSQLREVRDQLAKLGWDPYPKSSADFSELIKSEILTWRKVVRESGVKVD